MGQFSFPGNEKLKSRKKIEELFSKGRTEFCYPVKLVWKLDSESDDNSRFRMGISASKRNFKKAVDRNLLKRRMREAFRLNKRILQDHIPETSTLNAFLVYSSGEISDYSKIESAVKKCLNAMVKKLA